MARSKSARLAGWLQSSWPSFPLLPARPSEAPRSHCWKEQSPTRAAATTLRTGVLRFSPRGLDGLPRGSGGAASPAHGRGPPRVRTPLLEAADWLAPCLWPGRVTASAAGSAAGSDATVLGSGLRSDAAVSAFRFVFQRSVRGSRAAAEREDPRGQNQKAARPVGCSRARVYKGESAAKVRTTTDSWRLPLRSVVEPRGGASLPRGCEPASEGSGSLRLHA